MQKCCLKSHARIMTMNEFDMPVRVPDMSYHNMGPDDLVSRHAFSPQHPGKSMDKAGNDLTEQHDIIII